MTSEVESYVIHPACDKWPWPSAAEYTALVADIKAKGLLDAIWLTPDKEILEGKVRDKACREAGVEPRYVIYQGDDPIGFTISHNKMRRHMKSAQLALIGEELSKLQLGTNRYQKKLDPLASGSSSTQAQIAEQLGINENLINDARALKRNAEPNIIALVCADQVGIKNATAYARHTPREEQRDADRRTIQKRGFQLRTPLKNGIDIKRKTASAKSKKQVSEIQFSSDQTKELSEKLRPLIKRLRFQSKQHITLFAPFELELIAFEMEKLLNQWANTETGASAKTASK